MDIKTSQISITSLAQKAVLDSNEELTNSPSINAVVSRIAALALSPAAALDLAIHIIATPLSFIYSIGKSVVLRKADFTLPWQHFQRIREAIFPIIFGTVGGIIHPYAGIYFTEPKAKHIAGGILLSNSKSQNNIVVSPISAYEEIHGIMNTTSKDMYFPNEYIQHVKALSTWEKPLEMVQAVEMFDLKLTKRGMSSLYNVIDRVNAKPETRHLAKKISLIAYPIFATLDIALAIATSAFLLCAGILNFAGAKSPVYLETTDSPVLHVYSIARIIMTVVSAVVGFGISLVNPEKGLEYSFASSNKYKMIEALLFPIFKRLNREVKALQNGERLLLPIVLQNNGYNSGKDLLPSRNSHMTYLLIERNGDSYTAELIERGSKHGMISNLTREEVSKVGRDCMRLRYLSSKEPHSDNLPHNFSNNGDLVDLGKQGTFTNCVVTNLFAALDVMNHRDSGSPDVHHDKTTFFRHKSMNRYDHYQYDFFPFAPMNDIINEIEDLKSEGI